MTMWTPQLSDEFTTKYRAIAAAIADDIASGQLKPGEKLPTQRDLSKRISVTIGTVGRAYALAEQQGLISLEVGRGSFVRSFESRQADNERPGGVIDLGLNLPPASEHLDLLAKTLVRISQSRELQSLFGTAPLRSTRRHREAGANWLSRRIECTPDDILICSGTQNALICSLSMLTRPGDSVLVEAFTFPGLIAAARLLHLKLIPVPMDEHGVVPDAMEKAARKHKAKVAYLNPTNQNPTTITMPVRRRKQVARILKAQSLHLIEDDVYGCLLEETPPPLACFATEHTTLISSLSKTLSVGLRVAYVVTPEKRRPEMLKSMRASQFFAPPISCEVAANWILSEVAELLLAEQRKIAIKRQHIARCILDNESLPAQGPMGHHTWLRLPQSWSGDMLERAAGEVGVNVYSGNSFDADNSLDPRPGKATGFVRIALGAARNDAELQIGLEKIARLLGETEITSAARY